MRAAIREEIGDSVFCLLIDEARDESKREQMAVVLRFVDKHDYVQERGQWYDGANNMRGEWNGLQALFLKDCPSAHYVHCLAHRLQLALVSSAKEVNPVYQFFSKLTMTVNVVTASSKRHDQLRAAQAIHISNMFATNEISTSCGLNQIGTLQRAGNIRWGSYLNSARSLICLFHSTCVVLEKCSEEGNYSTRGEATSAYDAITTFEFVFLLHLMKDMLGISHD
ncbi:uncharacterized protein [Rutidosis leptorrhynchoides]|uniref:uncharacterized protein n=1 Tax=Rutidosis leptorrhynchoides TaxID=125765 RepID=UPI003A98E57A